MGVTSAPLGIKADDSGCIWYTGYADNVIGRLIIGSGVTEWDIPTANSGPADLAIDSNGDLWFPEYNGNKIGKFDTGTKNFTEYNIPTGASGPSGIDIADNGHIWFTESAEDKIGSLNPNNGVFNEINIAVGLTPWDLAVNDSWNEVWYTELIANSIGYLNKTTENVFTIDTSSISVIPHKIFKDSNNNLWASDRGVNMIARYEGKGLDSVFGYVFDTGNALQLNELTEDGQSNIWVAAQATGELYRLDYIDPSVDSMNLDDYEEVSEATDIVVTASDNTAVTKVEFYVDGDLKNTDETNDFSWELDPDSYDDGYHSVYVYAYDEAGNFDYLKRRIEVIGESADNGNGEDNGLSVLPKTGENMEFKSLIMSFIELLLLR